MYIDAELVTISYDPLILQKGMFFVRRDDDIYEIYELDHEIYDKEAYIANNGYPVQLQIYDSTFNHLLAEDGEIGWIDEGEDSEDMHDITLEDVNSILDNKGKCQIQIQDTPYEENKMIVPVFDEEKVIIKLIEVQEE